MLLWAVFASVGDVLTPLVTGGAIALGFSYRGAMLAIAVVVVVQCAGVVRGLGGRTQGARERLVDSEPTADPIRAALARAVRRPRLWIWLFAAASCTLLDELVVALAALRMKYEQGASEPWAAAMAATFAAGGILGAALADRIVVRLGARAVLLVSSLLCACALAAASGPRSAIACCMALFVVGVTCAPHHALAQARAYEEMPGNPGTVQAVAQLFVVFDVVAPLAVGFVADRFGLRAALACLALQPVVVAGCAGCWGGRRALSAGRPATR
jgi:MFS family permease